MGLESNNDTTEFELFKKHAWNRSRQSTVRLRTFKRRWVVDVSKSTIYCGYLMSEWFTVAALVIGPIAAVQVQKGIERATEQTRQVKAPRFKYRAKASSTG